MTTREHLMSLDFRCFMGKHLPSEEEAREWFSVLQAGWVYNWDLARPHAKLHSGKCSTGFFLCKRVLKFGNLREILAACIIQRLEEAGMVRGFVKGVFGAPYSSITLAADVARLLCVPNYIVEKGPKDTSGKDTMVFKDDDPIPRGSVLLQIEELITTSDNAIMAKEAIERGNPHSVRFSPFIGALVHRPPEINRRLPDDRIIIPFIEKQVDAWQPADCPLCKQGSKPLPPKTHWAELTAQ